MGVYRSDQAQLTFAAEAAQGLPKGHAGSDSRPADGGVPREPAVLNLLLGHADERRLHFIGGSTDRSSNHNDDCRCWWHR